MAIQKKSMIGKRQSVKKALVARRVSADAPKAAEQMKTPFAPQKRIAPMKFVASKGLSTYRVAPQKGLAPFKYLVR